MVIQRWQSVMLLIATALMIICVIVPIDGVRLFDVLPVFIVGVLSAVFSLLAIFLYRQLDLQKRLALLSALFAAVTLVAAGVASLWLASVYIVPAFVLDIWAYFRIRADQNLLKSYDRLR